MLASSCPLFVLLQRDALWHVQGNQQSDGPRWTESSLGAVGGPTWSTPSCNCQAEGACQAITQRPRGCRDLARGDFTLRSDATTPAARHTFSRRMAVLSSALSLVLPLPLSTPLSSRQARPRRASQAGLGCGQRLVLRRLEIWPRSPVLPPWRGCRGAGLVLSRLFSAALLTCDTDTVSDQVNPATDSPPEEESRMLAEDIDIGDEVITPTIRPRDNAGCGAR
jgi:hypothetical protein